MRVINTRALKKLTGDNFFWSSHSGVNAKFTEGTLVYGIRCRITFGRNFVNNIDSY